MALSNWDTFAINEKNDSCRGEFISPLGVKVKVYKNWLSVEDKVAWRKGSGYIEPVVMKIYTSEIEYMDVNIISEYQYQYTEEYGADDDFNRTLFCIWSGWCWDNTIKGIVGICKFDDIQKEDIEALRVFLNKSDNRYERIPNIFKNINLSKGKRYNQGDMFFHETLGTDTQCTVPGEAKLTVFEKLIKNTRVVD